ncbi:MAG: alpha/beta hydrolase [Deltaproteobacteria bacterium]|nr:alpha/beta hydrolase [Deltaproteobacteria bacterium]
MIQALVAVVVVVAAKIPLTPCTLTHPAGSRAYAQCGEVAVAIDPAHPDKTLSIGFAVLPATGTAPLPDPIVFLAGGPGQAATRDYLPLLPLVRGLRADHTLILLDIRGTGRSHPQQCKDDRPLQDRIRDQEDVDVAVACAGRMTLDPHFITTSDAARDVDAVRAALGFESWNVLGVSYGTRLAIVYDQLFPGRARTLILDGVAPMDRALGEDVPADMTAALRAAGDDVVTSFVALKAQLKATPRKVKVPHPTTGKSMELEINADVVNGTVRMLLYADESRALLGPILKQALVDNDLTPLVALAISVGESLEGAIHAPVNASILCAEDAPFYTDEPPPADAVFDDERPYIKALCAKWPHATVPRPQMKPTSTPTLLLSGALDPITPPRHAQRIESQFADHAHVIIPGMGHSIVARGCVEDVVADFVAAKSAKGLDSTCVKKIAPFPAFVDLMGPAP